MAIYHDAYLFSPAGFANFIRQTTSKQLGDWGKLIEQALIFAEDSFVLELADNYGGWDYESIKVELIEEVEDKPYLARFIFMIYLYKNLGQFPKYTIGLAHEWRQVEKIVTLPEEDRQLLVYGHPLADFIQYIPDKLFGEQLADDLHPFSTGGHAGYLSLSEITLLHDKVELIIKSVRSDSEIYHALLKAKEMLEVAHNASAGLCLIVSG